MFRTAPQVSAIIVTIITSSSVPPALFEPCPWKAKTEGCQVQDPAANQRRGGADLSEHGTCLPSNGIQTRRAIVLRTASSDVRSRTLPPNQDAAKRFVVVLLCKLRPSFEESLEADEICLGLHALWKTNFNPKAKSVEPHPMRAIRLHHRYSYCTYQLLMLAESCSG